MGSNDNNLIWIDLEMTGLDPNKERIIEIATIITDQHLNILAEGPVFAIHQDEELLSAMSEWCTKQHTKSGLVKRVRESGTTEAEAEQATIEFIQQYVRPNKSPMCGNSICLDRRFLYKYMSTLEDYFHYRNLDVSTIKELAKRWAKHIYKDLEKESKHLALADIKESIEELRYYRKCFFKLPMGGE